MIKPNAATAADQRSHIRHKSSSAIPSNSNTAKHARKKVAENVPLAIGDRELNARDQEILRVTIHQALHKIAKRGAIERIASVGRIARWQVTSR